MSYILLRILILVSIVMTSSCSSFLNFSDQSSSANNAHTERESNTQIVDNKKASVELNRALSAIEDHDMAAAESAFKAMLLAGAQSPTALNHYAIFLREQWRMEEAEAMYLQALKNSPNNAMTHWNIAIFYELYRGDYQQALDHYQAYQQYAASPDKRVIHWISDLNRRIEKESS
ncbi:MAG: tetratricopeptide repeat protein [Pseudomonadales bacterium]